MKPKVIKGNYSEADSKVIASELIALQRKAGVIIPQAVVQTARRKDSPLHRYFEWDDTVAGEKFRLWQARQLIASVWIEDSDSTTASTIRAFVHLKPEEDDDWLSGQGYVFTPSIRSKQNYQEQVLEYARSQLKGWNRRFGHLKEFFGVAEEIKKLK